jgi:hypothetical protein
MQNELSIAKKEYTKLPVEGKQLLEKIFGKEPFQFDWRNIDSFEKACEVNGTDPISILPYPISTTPKQEWLNALAKMDEIIRAINPGFTPDYSNSSQYKWYGWFKYESKNSGFRFDDSGCDGVLTYSTGGSRLCSESEEKAIFIAKTFIDIWNIILLK